MMQGRSISVPSFFSSVTFSPCVNKFVIQLITFWFQLCHARSPKTTDGCVQAEALEDFISRKVCLIKRSSDPKMAEQTETKVVQYDEKHSTRLWRKMKDAPFVPLGIAGLLGTVTYGIFQYRNRGSMSTSVYIMHFRVFSQGMVVGAITIGIGINIAQKLWQRYTDKSADTPSAGSS